MPKNRLIRIFLNLFLAVMLILPSLPVHLAHASTGHAPARQAAPAITATKADTLLVDNDGDGQADPGDMVGYTVAINNGDPGVPPPPDVAAALGLTLHDPIDAHTTLLPGSLRTTPLAYDATQTIGEDTPTQIILSGVDPDGQTLTFTVTSPPAHGTIGLITQINPISAGATYTPDPDYIGPDQFTFQVTDEDGNTDTATAQVTVSAVNDCPIARDDDISTDQDAPLDGNVLVDNGHGADSDQEGDPLAVNTVNGSAAAVGTQIALPSGALLRLNADGTLSYNPNDRFDSLDSGESDTDSFGYTVDDGSGACAASATVTVTVAGANDCPVARDDDVATDEDTVYNGSVLADNSHGADSDVDGEPIAVTAVNGSAANVGAQIALSSGALLRLNADGTLSYDPNDQFETLNDGGSDTDSFSYTIDDGSGCAQTAAVTVTITGVDDPPTAVDDSSYQVTSGTTLNVAAPGLRGNDDLGVPAAVVVSFGGGSLGGTVTDHAAGSTVSPVPGYADGSLTVNADGSFSFTPPTLPTPLSGSFTFDYRLQNVGGSSDATVTVEVRRIPNTANDAYSTPYTTNLTVAAPSGLLSNDYAGYPSGTVVSFGGGSLGGTVTDNAAGASVALAGGTLTINTDGSLSLSGQPFTPGSYTFLYRVQNAAGTSDAQVTIEVRQPPAAVDDNGYNVTSGAALNVAAPGVLGNDTPGHPAAVVVSFGGGLLGGTVTSHAAGSTVSPLPGYTDGSLTVNADGSFSFTPPTLPSPLSGSFTFDYRLQNTSGTSDATVTIEVRRVPGALADAYSTLYTTNLTVAAPAGLLSNDYAGYPSGAVVSFGGGSLGGTVTDNAAGASVALAGGTLTINADGSLSLSGQPFTLGTYTLFYRVQNAAGASDAQVTVEIRQPPATVNDSFSTLYTTDLTVAAPSGLLSNDDTGYPAGTVVSFGGGSLGGTVTDNAAGASVALADGTLTINTDGSLSLSGQPFTPGSYTFLYRVQNAAGASDAQVTVEIHYPPTAVDDDPGGAPAYNVSAGDTIQVPAPGVLGNDDLGDPAGTVVSFGGGSLGGTVTTHAAGSTVSPLPGYPDGSLTVSANGSLTLTVPVTMSSNLTFSYRLQNTGGFSDAVVTVEVWVPPIAVDDTVAAGSAPGDAYHTAINTTLNVTAPGLRGNDILGHPSAMVTFFGAIETNDGAGNWNAPLGAVTSNAAGSTVSLGTGSLRVNADGSLTFVPPTGYTGLLRFRYRIANIAGTSDAVVTLAVGVRPAPADDTYPYTVVGNVSIDTARSSGFSVLTNDVGSGLTAALVSAGNGEATIRADGTWTYDPNVGYEGPGSVTYRITNGFGSAEAQLNLTIADSVWFVDDSAASGGDGRLSHPYNCLVGAGCFDQAASDAANDNIYLYTGSYNGGLTLLNGQRLIGQGASSSLAALAGLTFPADSLVPTTNGTDPILTNGAGDGVILGQNNYVYGLTIGDTSGTDLTGTGFGTLTLRDVTLNGTGRALYLASGTADTVFDGVSSTSGANNVYLDSVNGTVNLSSGALSGASGNAFQIQGGSASVTYAGSIANTAATRLIHISGRSGGTVTLPGNLAATGSSTGIYVSSNTGGTITFSGTSKVLNTGTNDAVTLSSNTGATIAMTGGGLDIDTTGGDGLYITGGGTVSLAGANNTINTTTGTAVHIANTAIGAAGITLRSLTVNGASTGLYLANTGSGFFTVTGDGALTRNGSGGTLVTTGDGVVLNTVQNVTLQAMNITNSGGDGIEVSTASYLTFSALSIQNPAESALELTNLSGVNRIDRDSRIAQVNGAAHPAGITLANTNTNLTSLTLDGSTFANSSTATSFVLIDAQGTSNMTITVNNCIFEGLYGEALQTNAGNLWGSTGTLVTNVTNSTFRSAAAGGTSGLWFTVNAAGATQEVHVTGNTLYGLANTGSTAGLIGLTAFEGTLRGTISGNTIGSAAGVAGDRRAIMVVSEPVAGTTASVDVTIDNNNIDRLAPSTAPTSPNWEAILIDLRTTTGSSEVTITNNRIGQLAGYTGLVGGTQEAIEVRSRGTTARTLNLLIQGNTVTANTSNEVLDIDAEDSSTINATVTNNALTNNSTGVTFAANTEAAASAMCLDIRTNTAAGGSGANYNLTQQAGTFRVEGAGTAAVTAANIQGQNSSGTAAVTGTVTFNNNANCGMPLTIHLAPGTELAGDTSTCRAPGLALLLPANASLLHRLPPQSGETIDLPIGTLPAGKAITVTFQVTIDNPLPAGLETVSNQATLSGSNLAPVLTDDPDTGTADDPTVTAVDAAPDLQLGKDDGVLGAAPGGLIIYTLTYTNAGSQGASGVVLHETVPDDTTFRPADSTPGWSCAPGSGPGSTCTLAVGGLAGGGSGTALFAVIVDATAPAGTTDILNHASVNDDGANGADLGPADNETGEITPLVAAPDLTLSKSAGTTAIAGQPILYTLEYANAGSQDATGVWISETVPPYTRFSAAGSTPGWSCTGSGGPGSTCTLAVGALNVGASGTAFFRLQVDGTLPDGVRTIVNTAQIHDDGSNGADLNPANNQDSVTTPTTIRIYLPLVVRDHTAGPDLVVESITANRNQVVVVIRNQGDVAVKNEFWVDVYINPTTPPTRVNQTWQTQGGDGLVWGVTASALGQLVPGGAITLRVNDPYFVASRSHWSGTITPGSTVYAQADSANAATTYGAVRERHEIVGGAYNNIRSILSIAADDTPTAMVENDPAALNGMPERP